MEKFQRKALLQGAGGAVLAIASFFYPGIGGAAGSRMRPPEAVRPNVAEGATVMRIEGADPGFASGEVVARTSEGVVLQSPSGVRALRLPVGATVWKEIDVPSDQIQLHDWVDARGVPLADGSLEARSGWTWINIGRRDGTVERASAKGLSIRDAQGNLQTVEVSVHADLIDADSGLPDATTIASLTPGTHIGMVGLRLPNGGFRVTRAWINNPK